jgi:hypothetical protein
MTFPPLNPAARKRMDTAWAALVSGTRTCRCGNIADPDGPTDHLDDPLCAECSMDECNRMYAAEAREDDE